MEAALLKPQLVTKLAIYIALTIQKKSIGEINISLKQMTITYSVSACVEALSIK